MIFAKKTGEKKRVFKTKSGSIESKKTTYDNGTTIQKTQKFKSKKGSIGGHSSEVARKTTVNGHLFERKGQGANKKKAFLKAKK